MLKMVAVIIPFYKETLSEYEKISLQQCENILSKYTKIAVKPHRLTLPKDSNTLSFSDIVSFDNHYFENIAGYNQLMLSPEFYKQFLDYEYILIYQLDTFVFKDELAYWCSQNFDYIGAPWIKKTYHKTKFELFLIWTRKYLSNKFNSQKKEVSKKHQLQNKVGNGGFSLRKVEKFYKLCLERRPEIDSYLSQAGHFYNEDVFWSIEANRHNKILNIPDCETGLKFAFEVPPVKVRNLNDQNLPFGCHDWDKYADYWRPVFKNYNHDI